MSDPFSLGRVFELLFAIIFYAFILYLIAGIFGLERTFFVGGWGTVSYVVFFYVDENPTKKLYSSFLIFLLSLVLIAVSILYMNYEYSLDVVQFDEPAPRSSNLRCVGACTDGTVGAAVVNLATILLHFGLPIIMIIFSAYLSILALSHLKSQ